jgi:hypothetical protein
MNAFKVYILHSLILSVFILSIALLGCDTPECCGFGCGILGGSQSADCGASSSPPEPFMGFRGPGDIAVTIDGDFVVIDSGAVLHVDQTTGDRTIISKFAPLDKDRTGGGPRFGNVGIAVTIDGDFVVIDSGLGAVVHVDQITGDRTILSDDSTGGGPGFLIPKYIAVTTDGDFVVSETEARINAVVHVDQITGDRTILSDATTGTGP